MTSFSANENPVSSDKLNKLVKMTLTTTERNNLTSGQIEEGMIIYNTTLKRFQFVINTTGPVWANLSDGVNVEALSAQKTLTTEDEKFQRLDPGGANRDILLPAEGDSEGLSFYILNTANAAEDLIVKEDSDTTTIVTISQNEAAVLICDGTTWHHMGIQSIALS